MIDHSTLPSIAGASLPAKYEAAKFAILEAANIDECKGWADKAQALASYAKQSKDDEMEKLAQRIRARAVRRCGQLLEEIEKAHGANQNIKEDTRPNVQTRKESALEAGLSEHQSKQALRVANVPESDFEEQLESDTPPTVTKLAEQGTKKRPESIPHYEQQGMTKEQFRAGMHFRGRIKDLAQQLKELDPQTAVDGSTPEERKTIRKHIGEIESFFDIIVSKL